jgi:O-antigen/teichoic acid export membrane protein
MFAAGITSGPVLLAAAWLSQRDIGALVITRTIGSVTIVAVGTALGDVLTGRFRELVLRGAIPELRDCCYRVIRAVTSVAFLTGAPAVWYGREFLLTLLGRDWSDCATLWAYIAPAAGVQAACSVFSPLFGILQRQRLHFFLSLGVTMLQLVALLAVFGGSVESSCIAISVASSLAFCVGYLGLLRSIGVKVSHVLVIICNRFSLSTALFGVMLFASQVFGSTLAAGLYVLMTIFALSATFGYRRGKQPREVHGCHPDQGADQ